MQPYRGVKWCSVVSLVLMAMLFMSYVTAAETSCRFRTQRLQCGDLACDRETNICVACRVDSDCYPGAMRCDVASGRCKMRSFTSFFGARAGLAILCAFLICSIGVVAGVGGGGILVPMFCGLLEVSMQSAVGLSQSTICGQSALNMYLAVQKKHVDTSWDRPLINYQYLSLLLPLGLIGTLIGGILSKFCPDVLRLVLLFVVLSAVLYRTLGNMRKQYKQDTNEQQMSVEISDMSEASRLQSCSGSGETQSSKVAGRDLSESRENTTVSLVLEQTSPPIVRPSQSQYPQQEIAMNFASFFVLLLFNIFRTYSVCGGFMYWLCVLVPLLFLSVVFYFNRQYLCRLAESNPEQVTFPWTQENSVTYPMVAVIAGAAAAMLGIGGGLVLGFVLYEVGLAPQEASATGGMATFFIAFSSALQLLVTSSLVVDRGIVLFIVGLCSTALGHFVFMKYIKEHGLDYLILGSLAFIVGGSLVVLGGYSIYNTVMLTRAGDSVLAFGRLCARTK
ncbi:hypothetical protein JKF63_02415 [Porcisia hertigi]|uniref:Sulfite exporter TauE/SafE n=1 Tax=Porcisia hertigi TaxID=2761500 RepID=A0A836L2R9_9TRYP|nr:hypothetical protein JKF63_02415 [Porcisia hertigi]